MRGASRKIYQTSRPLTEAERRDLLEAIAADLAAMSDMKAAQAAYNDRVNQESDALKRRVGAAVRQIRDGTMQRRIEAVPDYDLDAQTVTWVDPETEEAIETEQLAAIYEADAQRAAGKQGSED